MTSYKCIKCAHENTKGFMTIMCDKCNGTGGEPGDTYRCMSMLCNGCPKCYGDGKLETRCDGGCDYDGILRDLGLDRRVSLLEKRVEMLEEHLNISPQTIVSLEGSISDDPTD